MSSRLFDILNNMVTQPNMIIVPNVGLGTHSFNSSGAVEASVDVENNVPSGYKLVGVLPRATNGYAFQFYTLYAEYSGTTPKVRFQMIRRAGSAASCSPSVDLICARDIQGGGVSRIKSRLARIFSQRGGVVHE